jgi:ATP-binding cassette subfamily B protein
MIKRFPLFRQHDQTDCGPACLRMVAAYYGKRSGLEQLRLLSGTSREGSSLFGLRQAAEQLNFRTLALRLPFHTAEAEQPDLQSIQLPCIVHWEDRHFLVIYRISKKKVWVADPAVGKRTLSKEAFEKGWNGPKGLGKVLLLEPEPGFYQDEMTPRQDPGSWGYLLRYFQPYKGQLFQLLLFLLLASGIQLLFPFFTQAVVDIGIDNQDLNFIILLLVGQFMLFLSYLLATAFQNWILLHLGARVNIAMIADYLWKLMKQPMRFFDQRHPGDLIQRISDHSRIEAFLTASTLSALFSVFTFFVLGIVLWIYKFGIFLIFFLGSLLYLAWILLFLKRRRQIDYQQFIHLSDHQNALLEVIHGMADIKVQGNARQRKERWMEIQGRLFQANLRQLLLSQYQEGGASLVNQMKDLLITFVSAAAVIQGEITLGMMLAIQYIVGQLNAPLQRILHFIQSAQDARISLERLSEVHQDQSQSSKTLSSEVPVPAFPEKADLSLERLFFRYDPVGDWLLKDVEIHIPYGSLCALVGASGSGKTTLMKLLLGFYPPGEGTIRAGGQSLNNIPDEVWRQNCSAVFQDGFIFSDTIAQNIVEGTGPMETNRLAWAVKISMLEEWVNALPSGLNTKVGEKGMPLSQGQKQRILLARALYKPADYLFLDEATNALDATNERHILDNLRESAIGRTIVVAAHRLSTIRRADQIFVLERGRIVEKGTHEELLNRKGAYFKLINDQIN